MVSKVCLICWWIGDALKRTHKCPQCHNKYSLVRDHVVIEMQENEMRLAAGLRPRWGI